MRKIIYTLCALVLVASCKENKPKKIDYVIVSGKIENTPETFIKISKNQEEVKEIKLNADGSFVDTLRVDTGAYSIHSGNNIVPVYLKEERNININVNADDFKNSLVVTGVGAPEVNFLILKDNEKKQFYGDEGLKFYVLKEEEYDKRLQNFKTKMENVLDANSKIDSNFSVLEKKDLDYFRIEMLLKHQDMHRYFAKDSAYTVSKDFLKDTENLSLEDEESFKHSDTYHAYRKLVVMHYQNLASKLKLEKGVDYDLTHINVLKTNKNDFIRNSILMDVAPRTITYVSDRTAYYNIFMEISTNEEDKKVVTDLYNELQLTSEGQPSPKFVNYENYKGGTTSLDDFKGKYVYIDVWATWCGPCLYEVPFLQEVEKQYHGKNVEFVSISVDSDKDYDKWKQMVVDKEMGGVQLYADKSFDSDFMKSYIVKAIPKFILIDPDGKIVKSNAPRPSDKKLINLLEELGV